MTETDDDLVARVREFMDGLTSCDFVGDSGCSDLACWRCHSIFAPENLRTLAGNLATAAFLCFAWEARVADPSWWPGCEMTAPLPPYMEEAIASPHVGAFLRRPR